MYNGISCSEVKTNGSEFGKINYLSDSPQNLKQIKKFKKKFPKLICIFITWCQIAPILSIEPNIVSSSTKLDIMERFLVIKTQKNTSI